MNNSPKIARSLNELALLVTNKATTRDDVIPTYASLINRMQEGYDVPWDDVNRVIGNRWSLSGLTYIKKRAWQYGGIIPTGEIAWNEEAPVA